MQIRTIETAAPALASFQSSTVERTLTIFVGAFRSRQGIVSRRFDGSASVKWHDTGLSEPLTPDLLDRYATVDVAVI